MRSSTIFKNRWMALLWAAGIVWFALDVAGSAPEAGIGAQGAEDQGHNEDVTEQAVNQADLDAIASLLR